MSAFQEILELYNFSFRAKMRTYQRWYAGTPYEHVEQYIPTQGNIVDLGCGWGMFANLLALKSPQRNVYGIDLDTRKISWAKKTLTENRKNINFLAQDLKDLDLPSVEAVVLYDVAHHLEEETQTKVLQECYKKLSVGGYLILKENDVVPFWKLQVANFVEAIALGFNITESAKVVFRSREDWKKRLTSIGFTVVSDEHIETPYGFFVPHSILICQK